jgi:hypothetical protein
VIDGLARRPRVGVFLELFFCRDGDDPLADCRSDTHTAVIEPREDLDQRIGELSVLQRERDRRVAIDAGGFESFPIDEDVGLRDVAKEIDHVVERRLLEIEFRQDAIKLGCNRRFGCELAALGGHALVALLGKIRPVLGVAQDVVVGDLLLVAFVELLVEVAIERLAILALLCEHRAVFNERLDTHGVVVARVHHENLINDGQRLGVLSLLDIRASRFHE